MEISDSLEYQQDTVQLKRQKHNLYEDSNRHNLRGCVLHSFCMVEGSLSKGFEGYLSISSPLQLNQKNKASYIQYNFSIGQSITAFIWLIFFILGVGHFW